MPNRIHNKQVAHPREHPMSDMGKGSIKSDPNPKCQQVMKQPIKTPGGSGQTTEAMVDKIY